MVTAMTEARKVHYEYDKPKCGCGDSFCGECAARESTQHTACGAWPQDSAFRTRDIGKTTCEKCRSKEVYQKACRVKVASEMTAQSSTAVAIQKIREDERQKIAAWFRGLPHDEYSPGWVAEQIAEGNHEKFPHGRSKS